MGSNSSRTKKGGKSDVDSRLLQQISSKWATVDCSLSRHSLTNATFCWDTQPIVLNIQQIQQIELDKNDKTRMVSWRYSEMVFLLTQHDGKELHRLTKGWWGTVWGCSKGKQLIEQAIQKDAAKESLPIQVTERLEERYTRTEFPCFNNHWLHRNMCRSLSTKRPINRRWNHSSSSNYEGCYSSSSNTTFYLVGKRTRRVWRRQYWGCRTRRRSRTRGECRTRTQNRRTN